MSREISFPVEVYKEVCSMSENENCFDCNALGPDWSCVLHGTLICLDCAGKHRSLGVQISFVRSLHMDKWTQHQIDCIRFGGNSKLKSYFAKTNVNSLPFVSMYESEEAEKYRSALKTYVNDVQTGITSETDTPFTMSNEEGVNVTKEENNLDEDDKKKFTVIFREGSLGLTLSKDEKSNDAVVSRLTNGGQAITHGVMVGDIVSMSTKSGAWSCSYDFVSQSIPIYSRPLTLEFHRLLCASSPIKSLDISPRFFPLPVNDSATNSSASEMVAPANTLNESMNSNSAFYTPKSELFSKSSLTIDDADQAEVAALFSPTAPENSSVLSVIFQEGSLGLTLSKDEKSNDAVVSRLTNGGQAITHGVMVGDIVSMSTKSGAWSCSYDFVSQSIPIYSRPLTLEFHRGEADKDSLADKMIDVTSEGELDKLSEVEIAIEPVEVKLKGLNRVRFKGSLNDGLDNTVPARIEYEDNDSGEDEGTENGKTGHDLSLLRTLSSHNSPSSSPLEASPMVFDTDYSDDDDGVDDDGMEEVEMFSPKSKPPHSSVSNSNDIDSFIDEFEKDQRPQHNKQDAEPHVESAEHNSRHPGRFYSKDDTQDFSDDNQDCCSDNSDDAVEIVLNDCSLESRLAAAGISSSSSTSVASLDTDSLINPTDGTLPPICATPATVVYNNSWDYTVAFPKAPLGLTVSKSPLRGIAEVVHVYPNSVAHRRNVCVGDVIMGVNNNWIGSGDYEIFIRLYSSLKQREGGGFPMTITFRRGLYYQCLTASTLISAAMDSSVQQVLNSSNQLYKESSEMFATMLQEHPNIFDQGLQSSTSNSSGTPQQSQSSGVGEGNNETADPHGQT